MTFLHFSSYIRQHFVLAERKIKYAFKCQTLESKEKHSSIHSEKNPNHKQVLVYLKLHQVHIKPRKMKQMRESNLHKGHQFQGNNIVDHLKRRVPLRQIQATKLDLPFHSQLF